jgi:hypothetical protein
MKLHVLYRSSGASNLTGRPAFFSKDRALASLALALEQCGREVEVIFLNDGPIPAERLSAMKDLGEPVRCRDGGKVKSHLSALELVLERGWDDHDLVYIVEDDYLHSPDALSRLLEAASEVPEASYFALYATIDWLRTEYFQAGETYWHSADSTTSTFAARVGALRKDMSIHRLAPRAGGPWDRTTCHTYQGRRPFTWSQVVSDVLGTGASKGRGRLFRARQALWRLRLNGIAARRTLAPHFLVAPFPALATHMMLSYLAPGVDWAGIAQGVDDWVGAAQLLGPLS